MYFSLNAAAIFPASVSFLLKPADSFPHLIFLPPVNAGLPFNIAALMPMLMVHFDQPDDFCVGCAQTLSKVQWSVHLMYGMTIIHPPACMNTHTYTQMFSFMHHIDTQSCTTAYSEYIRTCGERVPQCTYC